MKLNLEMLLQTGFLLYLENMTSSGNLKKILEFVFYDKIMGKWYENGKPEILYLFALVWARTMRTLPMLQ